MALRDLTPAEGRVLAVLVEKQATVPDTYPLSLNALVAGCNQKSARDPVMSLSEADVLEAIEGLRELSLVNEVSGMRVTRYDHNAPRGLGVPGAAAALLTTLLLRGPQTAAELRANSERLHRFADTSSVEGFLEELAEKDPPRVVRLARSPGAREARWAQLLTGEPALPVASAEELAAPKPARADEIAALRAEVAELRALVLRLASELGVDANLKSEA
ncbi:YceH family protein [Azohydromonas caseinilytica]|uniref:YceH family protein n=1 Tax=Azohydromonas caseinilytica TaxID=2728836 RepID=UPI00197C464B|nr:YceH family protein [Azohydromonas caseinilytica]